MNIELNTNIIPIFSGTYGTIWEVIDTDDDGNELEIEYDLKDLLKTITDAYQDAEADILECFDIDWITAIKFTGSYSPKEYNFSTDQLDFTMTLDKTKMITALKNLEYDESFRKYLSDNFTSYDGFLSFTPNNYKELLEQILSEGREYEQSVGALITYLIKDNIKELEIDIYYNWQENGYGGLDWEVIQDN